MYADGKRVSFDGDFRAAAALARDLDGFVWLGLHEPTVDQLDDISKEFDLHPLAIEDAVFAHQRPKLDRYDDMLFLVLKTVRYVEHEALTSTSEIVETGEVMVFAGASFAITVRHGEHGALARTRARLEHDSELLQHGPAAVLHAVADQVVDSYQLVSDEIERDVDEVETSVFSPRRTQDVDRIYQLKREVLELRRAVAPLRTALRSLAERHLPLIPPEIREYFRDVEDNQQRVTEQIGSFDELLTSILQASLARVTVSDNEDMRKISAWVAIAAVPTSVCAIYGMNFTHMPELRWSWGYPTVMGLLLIACVLLYRGFRRNGWL
ncbi:MAG: magnesium and cobalt transport protein CorA [Mycobacteriales bacterium]